MGNCTVQITFLFIMLVVFFSTIEESLAIDSNSETSAIYDDQLGELSILLDTLFNQYIKQCLRVFMIRGEAQDLPSNLSSGTRSNGIGARITENVTYRMTMLAETDVTLSVNLDAQIIVNQNLLHEAHTTIRYMNKNTERVTGTACVAYLLPGPPDSRLLPVLTDPTSSKRLTRYFLVHTQNSTEAEQFLLDQRLGKEENVAALVQEESQNKSYWRILIRQLLHPSGSPQVLTVNRWSRDTGLTSTENIFPEQMANFYGRTLRGVAKRYKPFVDFDEVEGSILVKPKPSIDIYILDVIAEHLNFTYEIALPVDGQWGYRKDDGFFTGVVGDVQMGRANFSLNLSIMQIRAQAIDFTRMYYAEPMTFIVAKSPSSPPWRKIITPFRSVGSSDVYSHIPGANSEASTRGLKRIVASVWLAVLVSVGGGSLLYHVIYHAQATLTSSRLLSSSAFMNVLASFLNQALFNFPKLLAARVFLGSWFLYAFLVTTYYKTSLTSTLAVPILPPSIDTLEQLHQSGVTYGINSAMGATYQLFSSSDIPLYQAMFQRMAYHTYPESLRLVAEGSYAYIAFRTPLTLQAALHNSNPGRRIDLHVAPDESFPGGYAWAFPKGAMYHRTFDAVKWRCVQAGLINKWLQDLFALYVKQKKITQQEAVTKDDKRDDRQVVLNLNHLQGPFFMLFLGVAGGLLLLLGEMLVAWQASRSDNN